MTFAVMATDSWRQPSPLIELESSLVEAERAAYRSRHHFHEFVGRGADRREAATGLGGGKPAVLLKIVDDLRGFGRVRFERHDSDDPAKAFSKAAVCHEEVCYLVHIGWDGSFENFDLVVGALTCHEYDRPLLCSIDRRPKVRQSQVYSQVAVSS
jgi:hypothetical protein